MDPFVYIIYRCIQKWIKLSVLFVMIRESDFWSRWVVNMGDMLIWWWQATSEWHVISGAGYVQLEWVLHAIVSLGTLVVEFCLFFSLEIVEVLLMWRNNGLWFGILVFWYSCQILGLFKFWRWLWSNSKIKFRELEMVSRWHVEGTCWEIFGAPGVSDILVENTIRD